MYDQSPNKWGLLVPPLSDRRPPQSREIQSGFYPFSTESDTGVLDETEPEIGYGVGVEITSEELGPSIELGPSMSLCRLLSLVLVLVMTSVLSSCVFITRMFDDGTPPTGPPRAEGVATVTRASGGSSTLIIRAELEELSGRTAYEAVQNLNQRWLQIRQGVSLRDGPMYARVVVD